MPPLQSAGPPLPISSPNTPSPRDPTHLLASEMVHLKMKLEEKRRAIEAQKKKVRQGMASRDGWMSGWMNRLIKEDWINLSMDTLNNLGDYIN